MTSVAVPLDSTTAATPVLDGLLPLCAEALPAAERLLEAARTSVLAIVAPAGGKIDADLLEANQTAAHGYAWMATYVEGLRQILGWANRLEATGELTELESLILQAAFGEYLAQLTGGIPLSQVEIVRPGDLGIPAEALAAYRTDAVHDADRQGRGRPRAPAHRRAGFRPQQLRQAGAGRRDAGHGARPVQPVRAGHGRAERPWLAQRDELIPLEVVEQMAELGVFGLTVPEEFGGLGMGKTSMCVVSEVLSQAYIGVGSLGTRSEIAAELIRLGGTQEQKEKWLPLLASGEILPTAVFTEPNTGSDLGSLRTRAVREGDVYKVTGNKTWITHASRSDLMTLLVRTDPNTTDYRGLSMLLAEKPRGTVEEPFPAPGMTGGEIEVLGYRGMKEYEIGFDEFEVPAANLLGGVEGQGFKQLMETFESARIQTAARATGVAQNALELGLKYAQDRVQFGKALIKFPRVAAKIGWMAVETMLVRQLTYFAAREKDEDRRCDIEAGMAKLLAARVAWSNADNALQIHGGNGYATEYQISRVLCDARILSVFEGAAEIQAQVIARGLLGRRN